MKESNYKQFLNILAKGIAVEQIQNEPTYSFSPFYLFEKTQYQNQIIVQATQDSTEESMKNKDKIFVSYPTNSEHAELFAQSETAVGGPNFYFPGSVAMLKCNTGLDILQLRYIQYSFIQGSPEELNRSIASKYMGARKRLLEQAFIEASSENISRVILSKTIQQSKQTRQTIDELLIDERFAHFHRK